MTKQDAVKALLALCKAKGVDTDKYDWIRFLGSNVVQLSICAHRCACGRVEWMFDMETPECGHCAAKIPVGAPVSQITITLKWGELTRDILEAARS